MKKSCEDKMILPAARVVYSTRLSAFTSQVLVVGLLLLTILPAAFGDVSLGHQGSSSGERPSGIQDEQALKIILGEARGEIFEGQCAVGEVLRRSPKIPFYGAATIRAVDGKWYALEKRKWVLLSEVVVVKAQAAWIESAKSNYSCGADHFEGDAFKRPYWSKDMLLTAKIGHQLFFKEVKHG